MDEKLRKLIEDFEEKLSAAQAARYAVLYYLEDEYEIDVRGNDYIDNKYDWCYGFDIDVIAKLLNERENRH